MTVTLGGTSTPVVGRRVMPTHGLPTGNDPALVFRRIMTWLQGRPGRGHAARWQVKQTVDPASTAESAPVGTDRHEHRSGHSTETVWGKVCGCACG